MLLAITKFELQDIRKAILSASKREEGYQSRLSDGLRVINAILSKGVEVMPVNGVDMKPVGNGKPGPVTRRIVEVYRSLVIAGK